MKSLPIVLAACVFLSISSCDKRSHPTGTASVKRLDKNTGSFEDKKAIVVKKVKQPTPKVISVNDNAARKTPDGRYYYDLNGKRYWKNNKDGKYYLFNKSMYNDDAFKGETP